MNGKKVRAKAPLRLGFGGGGTDVEPFATKYTGYVLNATINKYVHCSIESSFKDYGHVSALDIGEKCSFDESFDTGDTCLLTLGVYKYLIKENKVDFKPINIVTYSDVPGGSGLGSSSTMVVCILKAFDEYFNIGLGEYDLAYMSYIIEREFLGLQGGKQDQYCAAFGGFNFMEFNESTVINPLRIKNTVIEELNESTVLFYTGLQRSSADIIEEQISNQSSSKEYLLQLKKQAYVMKNALLKGDITTFAKELDKSWEAKKKTSPNISNDNIEEILYTAKRSGALSGKLSGAGGSGFMMFISNPEDKYNLIQELEKYAVLKNNGSFVLDIEFTKNGSISWVA